MPPAERAGSDPFEHDGNFDLDAVVRVDTQEVDVVDLDAEGVPLNVAEHGLFDVAFDVQIDDAGARLENGAPALHRSTTKGIDPLVAVNHAGNSPLAPQTAASRRPVTERLATDNFISTAIAERPPKARNEQG